MKVTCVSIRLGDEIFTSGSDGWLTVGLSYLLLEIYGSADGVMYRVLGDNDTIPALHRIDRFEKYPLQIPPNWVFARVLDRIWVVTPSAWLAKDFWTKYFDHDEAAVTCFDSVVAELRSHVDVKLLEA